LWVPGLGGLPWPGTRFFVFTLLYAKAVPIFVEGGTHPEKMAMKRQKMAFLG
jgi:hypothetical protein